MVQSMLLFLDLKFFVYCVSHTNTKKVLRLEHFFLLANILFTHILTVFTWKAKYFAYACFLHLLLHNFSGISGNLEQKKYFTDHQTAGTTQLFVAKKVIFLVYSFFEQITVKGNFPGTTCLLSHLFICVSL